MIEKLFAILLALPVSPRDAGEDYGHRHDRLYEVANAIAEASDGYRELAAFLTVQASHESAFRLDVQRCECRPNECDGGRAHGYWQLHRAPSLLESTWWAYCGDTYAAVLSGALRTATFYHPGNLAVSFAIMGGSKATINDSWVTERVAETLQVAGRL